MNVNQSTGIGENGRRIWGALMTSATSPHEEFTDRLVSSSASRRQAVGFVTPPVLPAGRS